MSGATEWLRQEGYRVEILDALDGFVCAVGRADERWLGWGSTGEEALQRVLVQMFSSHAARSLLTRALEAAEERSPPPQRLPDEASVPEIAITMAAQVVDEGDAVEDEEAVSIAARVPSDWEADRDARAADFEARELERARAELDALADRIEMARSEVALMAPALQRLHLTAWIAQARALQEASRDEPEIERRVSAVASLLSEIAKLWWPGSVIALQRATAPAEAARSMGLRHAEEAGGWSDVAEAAERGLREWREEHRDHEEDGWADAAQLVPPPPDSRSVLAEARVDLEAALGSIDRRPDSAARGALAADLAGVQRTVKAAHLLRWVRGAVETPELWARALGRLRWAASQRVDGAQVLRELLDPEYVPPQPWAATLGRDPVAIERRRRRKALLRSVPAPGSSWTTVQHWLVAAFDVGGEELPVDRIARHAVAFADVITEIDPMSLSSLHRKKLRKLKLRLGLVSDDRAPDDANGEPYSEPDHRSPPAYDAHAALARTIRGVIEGRRALFVSNRSDPDLQRSLEDVLGVDLAWCESDARRIQSACERIEHGTYDLVLCATGFADHAIDAQLYRAAKIAGVRYCRVGTGRPRSCVRALASQLGVRMT